MARKKNRQEEECCEADSLMGQSNSQLLVVFQYAQKWQEKKIYPSCLIWSAAKWKDVIEMYKAELKEKKWDSDVLVARSATTPSSYFPNDLFAFRVATLIHILRSRGWFVSCAMQTFLQWKMIKKSFWWIFVDENVCKNFVLFQWSKFGDFTFVLPPYRKGKS